MIEQISMAQKVSCQFFKKAVVSKPDTSATFGLLDVDAKKPPPVSRQLCGPRPDKFLPDEPLETGLQTQKFKPEQI